LISINISYIKYTYPGVEAVPFFGGFVYIPLFSVITFSLIINNVNVNANINNNPSNENLNHLDDEHSTPLLEK